MSRFDFRSAANAPKPALPKTNTFRHDPLALQNALCTEFLERAVQKTGSQTGFLALLSPDKARLEHWYTYHDHQDHSVADRSLAWDWKQAILAGAAQLWPMGLRSRSKMLVPIQKQPIGSLVFGVSGKIFAYSAKDVRLVSHLGEDLCARLNDSFATVEIEDSFDATLCAWAHAVEKLERGYSLNHFDLTAEWAVALSRQVGVSETQAGHIRRGAVLHDIGKMAISESILCKPGPLLPEEWQQIHLHPQNGHCMIADVAFLQPAAEVVLSHHERWDGTGYPHSLRGTEIPLSARIFAVVDVWDALLCDLPYRPAWPREMALAYIRQQAGKHFDPVLVDAFVRIVPMLVSG